MHNVAEFRDIDVTTYGLKEGDVISPEQTGAIEKAINRKKVGIVVPRHVYFQDGTEISFTPELVEEAFGEKIVSADDFMREDFTYLISPKTHFDATATVSARLMPRDKYKRIPDEEFTVFDLIQEKYGKDREIVYVGTGVVDNICRHYTTTGLKQKYGARVVNVVGATTELYGVGLGFESKQQVRDACERIQKDIGIEHKTLDEMIREVEGNGK